MLVVPGLVFIHLPKTGGSFCKAVLREQAGPVLYEGAFHDILPRLPAPFAGFPVLAFVRNPWDWYVSWYHHMLSRGGFNPLFAAAYQSGRRGFGSILRHVLLSIDQSTEEGAVLDAYMREIGQDAGGHDLNADMLAMMRSGAFGLLTWRYRYNLAGVESRRHRIGRYEALVDDFEAALGEFRPDLGRGIGDAIRAAAPENMSRNRRARDYRAYYADTSLLDLVADREAEVIERFGYRFEP